VTLNGIVRIARYLRGSWASCYIMHDSTLDGGFITHLNVCECTRNATDQIAWDVTYGSISSCDVWWRSRWWWSSATSEPTVSTLLIAGHHIDLASGVWRAFDGATRRNARAPTGAEGYTVMAMQTMARRHLTIRCDLSTWPSAMSCVRSRIVGNFCVASWRLYRLDHTNYQQKPTNSLPCCHTK